MEKPILIDEKIMSERLGISTKTAQSWRLKGNGPPYVKVSRLVRYFEEDIQTWLESQRRTSTSSREN